VTENLAAWLAAMCEGHQFSVAETVYADVGAVRAALLNVQNFDQFTSVAHSLQALSENEFSGMGRPLFLRELISVRLLQGTSAQGSSQDADSITVVLDDGFNLVQYAFKLRSSGPRQTLVECQVDCWNKQGTSWVGPSERLAKMMMKHESKLGQRLKGYVEAGQHSVYVC